MSWTPESWRLALKKKEGGGERKKSKAPSLVLEENTNDKLAYTFL